MANGYSTYTYIDGVDIDKYGYPEYGLTEGEKLRLIELCASNARSLSPTPIKPRSMSHIPIIEGEGWDTES